MTRRRLSLRPGVVRVERVYDHPRERTWRAIATAEHLSAWLMPCDFVPEVGHRFTFRTDPGPGFDGVIHCEVTELIPEERLAFTWKGGPLDTRVTFQLEELGPSRTRLVMEHAGFRGLAARLVQRILAIGCRTLYGKRLPALLDSLGGGDPPPASGDNACMGREQGVIRRLLGLLRTSESR